MEKIPITPQMLRSAVRKLQMRELFVTFNNLGEHIQRSYPVESDFDAFQEELQEKLKCAVRAGLLAKHDEDQYYIPYLRQEAIAVETAISRFWELYENKNRLRDMKKKKANVNRSLSCHKRGSHKDTSGSDESSYSEDSNYDRFLVKREDYI